MSANQVLFTENAGLATLLLNKPDKLNALDTSVFEQLLRVTVPLRRSR